MKINRRREEVWWAAKLDPRTVTELAAVGEMFVGVMQDGPGASKDVAKVNVEIEESVIDTKATILEAEGTLHQSVAASCQTVSSQVVPVILVLLDR